MTNHPIATQAPLSPDAAFVVHLTEIGDQLPDTVGGRVEHITSGRSLRFGSVAELLAFMRQVVTALLGLASAVVIYSSRFAATVSSRSESSAMT